MSAPRPVRPAPFSAARRRFLGAAAAAGGALVLPGAGISAARAEEVVRLETKAARAALGDGLEVPVWTFNGSVPGPTIRARQGEPFRAVLDNALDRHTTIHWHGVRLDNAMDGVPDLTQAPVAPGDSFEYAFTPPDAGTYWYHSHKMSPEQVARGLYGLLVVEEPETYPADREVAFVVDDWRINDQGEIDPSFGNLHDISHGGRLGNWVTVNGASRPEIPAEAGERLRLRVANTANARIMTLHFGDLAPWAIAVDGQPLAPVQLADGKLTLAPGQRTDLVVDVAGENGSRLPVSFIDQRGILEIAYFVVEGSGNPRSGREAPPALAPNPLNGALDADNALVVDLVMTGGAMGSMRSAVYQGREMPIRELVDHGMVWAFNGVAGMTDEPLFTVERGRTVFIDMVNDNRWPHAMHIHGHHFRVTERNGEPLGSSPWRDTTLVTGFDRSRLAFVADNPGKWLIHCHMLEHGNGGMMTWFEVT